MDEVLQKFCCASVGKFVGFLVFRVSGMAFYPSPADFVLLNQAVEFFP